jgi:MFS transporter, AAHS family, 4-hydroxybenzoate transporter
MKITSYDSLQDKLKDLIDNSQMSVYQIIIVAICFILNMNDGVDVLVVSFTLSDIGKTWGLNDGALGYISSAGLLGMTLGCFFLAPLGDKMGRRNTFIASLVLISLGMLGVYFVHSYAQLLACRFVTGLGIGGILPTMASTAAEFSNNKNRDFNVGLIQAGWPIGAILTGFFVKWAVPQYGWQFPYLIAGILAAFMLLAVIVFMPNSLAFLGKVQPPNAHSEINQLLAKMGHEGIDNLPPKPQKEASVPISALFTTEYKLSTILLWTAIFFGFLTLYTLMSWVPKIAKSSGMNADMAAYVGIALNIGAALGTVGFGLFSKPLGLKQTLLSFMLIAFGAMLVYGNFKLDYTLIFVMIFVIGFFVQGGFNGFYPIVARVYPSSIRSTGVGLAMGVGRCGAILGPAIFGILSEKGISIPTLFTLFSVPLLIAGILAYNVPSKELN